MVKTILLTVLAFLLNTYVFAQDYYVLHLSGKIKETSSQRNLIVGDVLAANTQLTFLTENAKAVVISKEKGRMLLDGSEGKRNYQGEFITMLQNVLMPVAANEGLSTRAVFKENKDIADLQAYFGSEKLQRAIIGEKYTLNLNPEVFKKKGGSTYIFKYKIGDEVVNKVIKIYEGKLTLDKKALFPVGYHDLAEKGTKAEFFSMNVISKKSDLLASTHICFVNEKVLQKEVNTIIKGYGIEGDEAQILEKVNDYFIHQYGIPFEQDLEGWLSKKGYINSSQK
ncbi:hypothetical protein [Flammeovirga agarivorans]|uniref:Uncharacterized protein n=1 Tax=Flammeovirga agarivorans TaxID=2726742 RepID=A0A7X8SHL4_9BACT|nr:hypothetical protein [Flammeovirga agarivorans]NLR90386.1 hypothetical protein [Flammeovirga agarivorans]